MISILFRASGLSNNCWTFWFILLILIPYWSISDILRDLLISKSKLLFNIFFFNYLFYFKLAYSLTSIYICCLSQKSKILSILLFLPLSSDFSFFIIWPYFPFDSSPYLLINSSKVSWLISTNPFLTYSLFFLIK